MTDMSAVERGEYPVKSMWQSKAEKVAFAAMITYSCVCLAYMLQYYTWGGQ